MAKRPGAFSIGALLGSVLAAVIIVWLLIGSAELPREAAFMGGIFVLATLLWVTEALPLFATSLLVLGLEVVLLANPGEWDGLGFETAEPVGYRQFIAAAADPILLLFFGGFLLARAAVNEGVDQAMSALLLRPFGRKPRMILLGLMCVTALFSMWMSNTATTAMMITLVAPMVARLPPEDRFRKGLFLCVPFAANIGGMGTPISSPPNAVAVGYLAKLGTPVTFLQWMLIGVPLMIVLILFAWELLWRLHRPAGDDLPIETVRRPLTRRSWFVAGVFSVTVLLWMTDQLHGLPASVVALLPAVAFTATGMLRREDVNSLDWHILILIAGGIVLGFGIQRTGLDEIFVGWLPLDRGISALLVIAVLVIATLLLSTFMSNTAAANLLLPIGVSTATALGGGALITDVAISIALTSAVAMALPISTPPNAIAYGAGGLTVKDMARTGAIIGIVAALAILFVGRLAVRLSGAAP
ncbi:MAG TPA: sodium:sulfate symporter [Verrucomicrobiales bacterium]|nr:sodium:sulfate symporter [Verrucomicrobiales bacterium]